MTDETAATIQFSLLDTIPFPECGSTCLLVGVHIPYSNTLKPIERSIALSVFAMLGAGASPPTHRE